MNELAAEDLVSLKREAGGPRLSLFLPLCPGSPRGSTHIAVRNALLRTDRALRAAGRQGLSGARLLDRVQRALDQPQPVRPGHRGLALFADPSSVRQYQVPVRVPELAVVGDRFTVAPVLPIISSEEFFLLCLGQDEIRLFRGTSTTLEQVEAGGRELAAWTTMPRPRSHPTHGYLADRGPECPPAVFRERWDCDDSTWRVVEHLRGTDRALHELLGPTRAPLVLAGMRSLQRLYRAITTCPRLLGAGIDSDPERTGGAELHRQAWTIAEPELRRDRDARIQRYRDLRGTGRTVDGLDAAHRAAAEGRIETIVVNEAAVTRHPAHAGSPPRRGTTAGASELLELAVVETLSHAGSAFFVSEAEMPGPSTAVAVLRN